MARPRSADHGIKRRAILDRSAALFARNGYDRTAMAEVAAACGVSKALLYHYYDSKDALLFDILREQRCGAIQDRAALDVVIGGARTGHQLFGLLSTTRRALPAERSMAPGSCTRTIMPMPILLRICIARDAASASRAVASPHS